MNILITGGSGFIGRNIIEQLGEKYNFFKPNHLELNLLKKSKVKSFIFKNKIDIIIHCSKQGDYGISTIKDFEDNVKAFDNLAENSHKIKKVIFFGSGAEYGKERELKRVHEEEFGSVIPDEYYSLYKYTCSKHIENCSNIVNLRLFGVYGKYENQQKRFISNAITRNIDQLPILIKQNVYFDYLYINDLVRIVDWFIQNDNVFKFYNCIRGISIDLYSLASIINEVSGYDSKIITFADGLGMEYSGNNVRLKKEIGEFSFTKHRDAIAELYNYYVEYKKKNN